jgi:hypothetical protein
MTCRQRWSRSGVRRSDAPGGLHRVVTNCRLRRCPATISAPAAARVRRVLPIRRGASRVSSPTRPGACAEGSRTVGCGAARRRFPRPRRRACGVSCPLGGAPRACRDPVPVWRRGAAPPRASRPPRPGACAEGSRTVGCGAAKRRFLRPCRRRAACPALSAGRPARVVTRCRSGGAVGARPAPPVRRARALAPKGHELSAAAPPSDAFCARGGARAGCPAPSAGRPACPVRGARALAPRGHELSAAAPPGDAFCARGGRRAARPALSAERPARVATRCRPGGAVRPRPAPPGRRARPHAPRGHELSAAAPSGDAFCARGGARAACPAPSAWPPARVATRCRPGGTVRPRPVPPVRPDARGNVGGRG